MNEKTHTERSYTEPSMNLLTPQIIDKIAALLNECMGLVVTAKDRQRLADKIAARMNETTITDPQLYFHHLLTGSRQSSGELTLLASLFANQESYFFRDTRQFEALEKHILPSLIKKQSPAKKLKIWCVGCARGEEPYSIAILLGRMMPNIKEWKISILGTDISAASIEQAKKGIYTAYEFRGMLPAMQSMYFHRKGDGWVIDDAIKNRVEFLQHNIVSDQLKNGTYNFFETDLILCRNVFIYFDQGSIRKVLNRFFDCMGEGGYLMTGEGEIYNQDVPLFSPIKFDGSIVYQKLKS